MCQVWYWELGETDKQSQSSWNLSTCGKAYVRQIIIKIIVSTVKEKYAERIGQMNLMRGKGPLGRDQGGLLSRLQRPSRL